jgi:Fe-S cluster biogenesis protein NfuA
MNDLRSRAEAVLRAAAPALGLPPDEITVTAADDGIATVRLGAGCLSCSGGVGAIVQHFEAELATTLPDLFAVELTV